MTFIPPILLILFNRPEPTRQVFAQVRRAQPRQLFLSADGPRPGRPDDAARCAEVRAIVTQVDWECEVHIRFSDTNLGCKVGPASAMSWFFDQVEAGIILEDDCLPDLSFFPFCAELLERYHDDERVGMVAGNTYVPVARQSPYSYYFSGYTMVWGWATWRRAWRLFDANIPLWPALKDDPGWIAETSLFAESVPYWQRMFDRVHQGQLDAWDYQWLFTLWTQNMLAAQPRTNLVRNIGFGEDATHTKLDSHNFSALPLDKVTFPLAHPPYVMRDTKADRYLVRHFFAHTLQQPRKSLYARLRAAAKQVLSKASGS